MNDKQRTKTSKFMSLVLRHSPQTVGITLDAAGWIGVDELLAAMARHGQPIAREELVEVVATSDKQRFCLSDDGLRIRANQGHSVEVELGYEAAIPPEVLYHGTARQFVESVRSQGLMKMQRHDVHLSESIEQTMKVGQRRGRPVLVKIFAGRMHRDGFVFQRTPNAVWLTERVPPQYLVIELDDRRSSVNPT